jgi:transposase
MYYIGIDYHKDTAAVCVQTGTGKVKAEYETTSDREGMDAVMEAMAGRRFKVMGETSTYSIDLHNYFVSKSVDSCLVDPRSLRLITRSDKKTDRHDAKVIATFLHLMDRGEVELSTSYILEGGQRDLRDICRYRERIGEQKGMTLRRMKSHMRIHSQILKDGYSDFGTAKGQRMLRDSFGDDLVLMEMLDDYVYFLSKSERIDRVLASAEFRTKEVGLLMSIPGIGRVTAVQMMSMIVDIGRFETADRMRSYFGMNTQVMDSGGKTRHGHVTKRGDPMMRNILGRVLNVYLAHCPDVSISVYHCAHKDAMGGKKVRMACMNKLLDVVFAVLKRGTPYVSRRRKDGNLSMRPVYDGTVAGCWTVRGCVEAHGRRLFLH